MSKPLFEEEAEFIKSLKTATGKTLSEWYADIAVSGLSQFLDIRKWLVSEHKLTTNHATALTRLYLEAAERGAPKVWFSSSGRGGDMGYESKEGNLRMYWEMGGGDVIAIIDVPTVEQWSTATTIPHEKRMDVLNFIGQKTVEKQTIDGKGSYEIQDNCILIRS